jgi:hypothetical protein
VQTARKKKADGQPRITWLWKKDKVIPYGDDQTPKKVKQLVRKKSDLVPTAEARKTPEEPKKPKFFNRLKSIVTRKPIERPAQKETVASQKPVDRKIPTQKRVEKLDRAESQPSKKDRLSSKQAEKKIETPEQVEYISGKKTIVTKKHVETSTIHQSTLKEKETVVEPKIVHFARHREIKLPKPEIINQYAITAIHTSNDRRANYTPVPAYDDSNVVKELGRLRKDVVATIKNQPTLNMNVTEQGIAAMYQHGANTTKYITDQTNWG